MPNLNVEAVGILNEDDDAKSNSTFEGFTFVAPFAGVRLSNVGFAHNFSAAVSAAGGESAVAVCLSPPGHVIVSVYVVGTGVGGVTTDDPPPPPPPHAARRVTAIPTINTDTDLDPRMREDDNALNAFFMNFFMSILLGLPNNLAGFEKNFEGLPTVTFRMTWNLLRSQTKGTLSSKYIILFLYSFVNSFFILILR